MSLKRKIVRISYHKHVVYGCFGYELSSVYVVVSFVFNDLR